MTPLRDNPRLGGFRPVRWRTHYAIVREPQLIQFWAAGAILQSDAEAPPPAEAFPSLRGVAVLEKDSVALIGATIERVCRLSLVMHAVHDWDAHRLGWKDHVTKWGDHLDIVRIGTTDPAELELIEFLTASYSRFEKRAPTALLYFSVADWEVGSEDEWGLELKLPLKVAQHLAQDISAGLCKELRVSFKLAACFADDENAPPSVGVTIGVPQLGEAGRGSLKGWVETVSWSGRLTALGDVTLMENYEDDAPARRPGSHDLSIEPRSSLEANEAIRVLAGTVRVGFIATFVLIGLVLLFSLIRCAG